MSFWDIIWFIFIAYLFFAYIMVMFSIIADVFRDDDNSGFVKALWIIALIFFPFLTALIYLIARGKGMAERANGSARAARAQQESYIREVAAAPATSSVDEIAKAKALLDAGTINAAEYDVLKAKALAG